MNAVPRLAFFATLSLALALGAIGCKSNQNANNDQTQPATQDQTQPDQSQNQAANDDPASANVVPISNTSTGAPSGASDRRDSGQYSQEGQYDSGQYNADNGYGEQPETYAPQPPPELPEYQQPPCPGDGYIWTPGYWNYASDGYYWVPGAWVQTPYVGALWTPGYWGWRGGRYAFYRGYWGRHIGYYGGINYGFGYVGAGYQGGYWNGDNFAYNRTVNNINTTVVHNVYEYRVTNITTTRVAFNGGQGGVQYRPRPAEIAAVREQHNPPMAAQVQLVHEAQTNKQNFANVNRGRPQMVVAPRPVPAQHIAPPPVVHYAAERPAARPGQPAGAAAPNRPGEAARPGEPGRPGEPNRAPETNRGAAPAANQPGRPAEHQTPQQTRPEQRNAPEQNRPANRTEPQQRTEPARPAPQRTEPAHPAPQRTEPAHPAPQRTEPAHPAPQRTEPAHPAPQHTERPAPQQHAEPARPAPEHKAEPAPQHKPAPEKKPEEEKKKPE